MWPALISSGEGWVPCEIQAAKPPCLTVAPRGPSAGTSAGLTASNDGVAFIGEGKPVSKGNWLRTGKAEATLSHIGFPGCAIRASGTHWSISVTHRFLRRGKILKGFWLPTRLTDVRVSRYTPVAVTVSTVISMSIAGRICRPKRRTLDKAAARPSPHRRNPTTWIL
jgi:hypothetical protein